MQPIEACRKFVTLTNGKEAHMRRLNGQDRSALIRFFQQAPLEDIQFCRQDVKSPKVIDSRLNQENYCRPLTLVAIDVPTMRVIASVNLSKGQQAALAVVWAIRPMGKRPTMMNQRVIQRIEIDGLQNPWERIMIMNGLRRLEEFILKLNTAQYDTKEVDSINEIKIIAQSSVDKQINIKCNNKKIRTSKLNKQSAI